uniref:Uncharacterized protein n=1 Tax=Quercus lobata TaxID=97700 RepID=A0A7N2LQ22_QUELO
MLETEIKRERLTNTFIDVEASRLQIADIGKQINQRRKNGSHIPKLTQLYYDTRFNSKTKQWVHPDCEHTYQEMLRVQDEHCSTPKAQPLTEEEISMMVLKLRSGYVKGLGMRPSSFLRTPAHLPQLSIFNNSRVE